MRWLVFIVLLAGCNLPYQHRFEGLGGYAFKAGDKEDSAVIGVRQTVETPLKETGLNVGFVTELNFAYTADAFEDHNYDLREFGVSPMFRISYPTSSVTPYFMIGPTLRAADADSDFVSDREIDVDLRIGVEYGSWSFEYRGTNTSYDIDGFGGGSYTQKRSSSGFSYSDRPKPPPVQPVDEDDTITHWVNGLNIVYKF